MAKGFFTQGVVVLLERPVSLDSLTSILHNFNVIGRRDETDEWTMSGPSLTLAYRPEVNGLISVDIVEQSWPDDMGDPQQKVDLFGAWSMGFFGPFTFPGSLERAVQHAWHWPDAASTVARHRSFLRVRSSYILGAESDALTMPSDYDALHEVSFLLDVTQALLDVPGTLCYFNPNGEMLLPREEFTERLRHDAAEKLPPLDILSNVRMMNINEKWSLMDTVGMAQLDCPDQEACFTRNYDPDEVARFLRNIAFYRLQNGDIIHNDNTTDGPNRTKWRARAFEEPLAEPPRAVLRWLPDDGSDPPPTVGFSSPSIRAEKKRLWPFGKRN
jgi:hypothetical protein